MLAHDQQLREGDHYSAQNRRQSMTRTISTRHNLWYVLPFQSAIFAFCFFVRLSLWYSDGDLRAGKALSHYSHEHGAGVSVRARYRNLLSFNIFEVNHQY